MEEKIKQVSRHIYSKDGKIEFLLRCSMQYKYLDYNWTGSVLSFIKYSIYKWNLCHKNKDDKIVIEELGIYSGYLETLNNSFFPK